MSRLHLIVHKKHMEEVVNNKSVNDIDNVVAALEYISQIEKTYKKEKFMYYDSWNLQMDLKIPKGIDDIIIYGASRHVFIPFITMELRYMDIKYEVDKKGIA